MEPRARYKIFGISLAAWAIAIFFSSSALSDVYVLCEIDSGKVVLREKMDENRYLLMDGPFPGERTATIWMEENCPNRQCDRQGICAAGKSLGDSGTATGGWDAGEVTSITLSSPSVEKGQKLSFSDSTTEPTKLPAPPSTDITPLINNTKAAAEGCNYAAALASIEHIANFDPEHPWYLANLEKLSRLARRQQNTEQLVWQASSALSAGDLTTAKQRAQAAADTAVSCQVQAVRVLLDGIDTAIKQKREAQSLANRKAAAALLPGLVDLSRALSGGAAGSGIDTSPEKTSPYEFTGYQFPISTDDPCSFRYEYINKWATEPQCTCDGYRFDAGQARCVK